MSSSPPPSLEEFLDGVPPASTSSSSKRAKLKEKDRSVKQRRDDSAERKEGSGGRSGRGQSGEERRRRRAAHSAHPPRPSSRANERAAGTRSVAVEESKDGYGYGAEEFEDVDELREPADEGCASPVGRGGRIAAARPASEDSHRPGKAKARSGSGSTIGSNSTRDTNDFAVVDLPDPYAAKILADDAAALRRWLFANHFDESVASTLSSYGVADVLALSKTDLKDLLGVSVGLRLFSRIAQQKALVEGGGGVPGVGVGAFGPSSAPSVRGRAPSRYGQCSQRDCGHPSVSVCSVAECGASVCVWHEAKSLLTSHVYCPLCERDTFEGRVRAAVANAAVSADAAATRIIDRTAEWTHSGRDAIAAHSLDSHEPPSVSEHGLPLPPSHGYQHTTAAFADEEKQPPQPRSGGSGGSVNGAGGARLPFVSDWLRGDEDGEEVEEEAHYRETSWNERAQAQCALQ